MFRKSISCVLGRFLNFTPIVTLSKIGHLMDYTFKANQELKQDNQVCNQDFAKGLKFFRTNLFRWHAEETGATQVYYKWRSEGAAPCC